MVETGGKLQLYASTTFFANHQTTMASIQAREWTGLQQFPAATQNALHTLLCKLKKENVDTLTVLVLGKSGVGKSSTVNSIFGERVAGVSAFQAETMRPLLCSRACAGFTLNIVDTPGLVEGLFVNDQALSTIRRFLMHRTIDAVVYVDRLDDYRVDNLDRQIIRAISQNFGPQIWRIALIALTHAQLSPPDGISYAEFVTRRSGALKEAIQREAGFKKGESQVPVLLVENSGRCSTNEGGEKILPDSTIWLPKLFKEIVGVVTNSSQPILINQKLLPNANKKGKFLIPVLLFLQYLFMIKPIHRAIERDVQKERYNQPKWEVLAEESRQILTPGFSESWIDELLGYK